MLTRIKTLLDISDEDRDALLNELITRAKEFIINYTNNEAAVDSLSSVIVSMVVYDYNKIGTEGLSSENYSGVHFNYSESYNSDIMRQLKMYRKVKTI